MRIRSRSRAHSKAGGSIEVFATRNPISCLAPRATVALIRAFFRFTAGIVYRLLCELPKLERRVRFPLPAPAFAVAKRRRWLPSEALAQDGNVASERLKLRLAGHSAQDPVWLHPFFVGHPSTPENSPMMRTLRLCAVLALGLALACAFDDDVMAKLSSALTESIERMLPRR
jgi:hypothetical protein